MRFCFFSGGVEWQQFVTRLFLADRDREGSAVSGFQPASSLHRRDYGIDGINLGSGGTVFQMYYPEYQPHEPLHKRVNKKWTDTCRDIARNSAVIETILGAPVKRVVLVIPDDPSVDTRAHETKLGKKYSFSIETWGQSVIASLISMHVDVVRDLLPFGFQAQDFAITELSLHNPPPLPEWFTGRENYLQYSVIPRLEGNGVTIFTGEGGVGKTTLAVAALNEVSTSASARFTVWVDCAQFDTLDRCVRAVGSALLSVNLDTTDVAQCLLRIRSYLTQQPVILCLDNLDDVIGDPNAIVWISELGATARVLITSRYVPESLEQHTLVVPMLTEDESVELFKKLVPDVTRLAWDGEDYNDIRDLCRKVAGLPLAIGLLAPMARGIRPVRLAELLSAKGVAILDRGGLPDSRHPGLKTCFELSYDRLSPATRSLLSDVCLLPFGATAETISAITKLPMDEWFTSALELVSASVWRQDRGRYVMHTLLQECAIDRRPADDRYDASLVWRPLLAHLVTQGALTRPGVSAPAERTRLFNWMESEWDNVLWAGELAWRAQAWSAVIDLSGAVRDYAFAREYHLDSLLIHRRALFAQYRLGISPALVAILRNLGLAYQCLGRFQRSIGAYLGAVRCARRLSDPVLEAEAQVDLGSVYASLGDSTASLPLIESALLVLSGARRRVAEGAALNTLGRIMLMQADYDAAMHAFERSLRLAQAQKDAVGERLALRHIGEVRLHVGDSAGAQFAYEEALAVARRAGDTNAEADMLGRLGGVLRLAGRWDLARSVLSERLSRAQQFGGRGQIVAAMVDLGLLYRDLEEWDAAEGLFQQCLLMRGELGDQAGEAADLYCIGTCELWRPTGSLPAAKDAFEKSLKIRQQLGQSAACGAVLTRLGEVFHRMGKEAEAGDAFTQAVEMTSDGTPVTKGIALVCLAEHCERSGDRNKALKLAIGAIHELGKSNPLAHTRHYRTTFERAQLLKEELLREGV